MPSSAPFRGGLPPVTAPEPYPPVKVAGPDLAAAQLLSQSLAGRQSELSSVTQYLYQSWALYRIAPEAGETMRRLAVVEMRRLDLLGELILLLGGDPRYRAANGAEAVYWDGGMPSYCTNPRRAMALNLEAELDAAARYRAQAAQIDDPYVAALLRRLLLDEEQHVLIFRHLLESGL